MARLQEIPHAFAIIDGFDRLLDTLCRGEGRPIGPKPQAKKISQKAKKNMKAKEAKAKEAKAKVAKKKGFASKVKKLLPMKKKKSAPAPSKPSSVPKPEEEKLEACRDPIPVPKAKAKKAPAKAKAKAKRAPGEVSMSRKCVHSRAYHAALREAIQAGAGPIRAKELAREKAKEAIKDFAD